MTNYTYQKNIFYRYDLSGILYVKNIYEDTENIFFQITHSCASSTYDGRISEYIMRSLFSYRTTVQ